MAVPAEDDAPSAGRPAALITGAARRLGREIALALADRGYDVGVHYHRSRDEATALVREIEAKGRRAVALGADLFAADAAERLLEDAFAVLPGLEIVVNNASVFEPGSLDATTGADFDRNHAIHLRTPLFLIQGLAARWPAARGRQAQVINLLDTRVANDVVDHFAYTLSKKGLADLTRLAARALAPRVRVNAVAPGVILPPPGEGEAYLARRAASVPLRQVGTPEAIVAAVLYLLDNQFVTGEILYVDGGQHLT